MRSLVIVHQRDDFDAVAAALGDRRELTEGGSLLVLVPSQTQRGFDSEGREQAEASTRLAAIDAALARAGVTNATTRLADSDILVAVEDALREEHFDEIVVAGPRERFARAVGEDVSHRLRNAFDIPVVSLIDKHGHKLRSRSLGLGVTTLDAGQRGDGAAGSTPTSHEVRVRWLTALVAVVAVAAAAVSITLAVHKGAASAAVDSNVQTLAATVGAPELHGATQSIDAFYANTIEAHPGDEVVFHNAAVANIHTMTFGVDADRANEPRLGQGAPNPTLLAPCMTRERLTTATNHCDITGALPPFDGQPFYSSGVIAGGKTFVLHLANDIAPGAYPFVCLIHGAQHGMLVVVPRDVAIQTRAQLAHTAATEEASDQSELARLAEEKVSPSAGATAQVGAAVGNVSVNQFFPSQVTIEAGETVTWMNPTATPHVIMVGGGLDPSKALFLPDSPPSGSAYTSGFARSGPIGALPSPKRTYRLRFMRPGTYTVICTIHPGMTQTIVVTP